MEIPHYPQARPLVLDDKELLDRIFQVLQPQVSELTFAGLYLFRRAHAYRLTMLGDALVVLGQGYDGRSCFLPPLSGDVAAALKRLLGDGGELYGADEEIVGRYLAGKEVTLEQNRDDADYIYLRQDLAELPGKRFHKKKNRISYFLKRHDSQIEYFAQRHVDGCLELLERWRRLAGDQRNDSLAMEVEAAAEAVAMATALGLEGVVVVVGGAVAAFALGERLNRDTAVCHFEKADPFMEGAAQLVNREFCRMLFGECCYVNREQDLGEAGLRNAKLSYHPSRLVGKYRARLYKISVAAD